MRNPRVGPWYDDFSRRLSEAIEASGLSQADLAKRLSVSEGAVSRWRTGQVPEPEIMPRVASILGMSLEQLFGLKPASKHSPAVEPTAHALEIEGRDYRLLGLSKRAGAGGPIQNYADQEALRLAFRADWLRQVCGTSEITKDRAFLVEVDGDSMEPTLMDGAVVLARREQAVQDGAIYVIREDATADVSGLIVKRLTIDRVAEVLIVGSDNESYSPYVIPLRGRELPQLVIGRVIWVSQQINGKPGRGGGGGHHALGKKPGRPRNIRRQPEIGERPGYDEDDDPFIQEV